MRYQHWVHFIRSLIADVAVPRNRIVRVTGDGTGCTVATDGSLPLAGTSFEVDAKAGQPVDVAADRLPPVEYGAAVTLNQPLTAGADGRAVPAQAGDYYVGFAQEPGGEGDVGTYQFAPGKLEA